MSRAVRRRAYSYGRLAEAACVWSLRLRGYRILARRFRTHVGEIDIVARRGRMVAIVEVKARHGETPPAVSPRQRRRIVRAAEAFLAHRPQPGAGLRFDLMTVARWRPPRHLEDAWRP